MAYLKVKNLEPGVCHGKLTILKKLENSKWLVECSACDSRVEMLQYEFKKLKTCGCFKRSRGTNEQGHIHNGYVRVHRPDHPRSDSSGWMYEHTEIMEAMLGREMIPGENVHHKNGIRHDNRPTNLELWNRNQPSGVRASDRVEYAIEILKLYKPEILKDGIL